jgi:long-chain acyl-CoA synthetase
MTAYTPRFTNLVELFQQSVERFAERKAFGTQRGREWHYITYAELDRYVAHARAALAQLGVGRGDRVAIVTENRLEWVILAHATFQRRAVFVPMSEAQHDAELKYILSDSGAKVCVVANMSVATRVSSLREDLLDLQHVIAIDGSDDVGSWASMLAQGSQRLVTARTPIPSDIATIIYTSGTTGQPKGVRLSHQNLASNAAALSEMRDFGSDPRTLAFLPWAHVFGGCVELNLALAIGATVAICRNPDQFFEELPRVRPTLLYGVPRIWQTIFHDMQRELAREPEMSRQLFVQGLRLRAKQQRGEHLSLSERVSLNLAERLVIGKLKARLGGALRLAFSGAAPLSVEVAEFLHAIGITVHEGYGLTESSGSSTSNPTGAVRIGSVGKPLLGTTIAIERRSTGHDPREGEVVIYGPGVMAGYQNQPQETARVLGPDGGLRTGDLGYLDQDGYLYITGRVKELYKLNNGRYIAPSPLEEKLKGSPFISNCMLYGAGQPYNVALVVADVPALQRYFGGDDGGDARSLVSDRRVRRLFEDEILKHSKDFRTFELVRSFWIETEPFTRENGMLTSSFKLRRDKVRARYEGKLLALYG